MKTCPLCKTINEGTAVRCDCGHAFTNSKVDHSITYDSPELHKILTTIESIKTMVAIFLAVFIACILLSIIGYTNAIETIEKMENRIELMLKTK